MVATPAPLFPALLVGAAGRSVLIRADAVALNSEPGGRERWPRFFRQGDKL